VATLARASGAVPEEKIVILMVNGYNDARELANSAANIAANPRHEGYRRDANSLIGYQAAGYGGG